MKQIIILAILTSFFWACKSPGTDPDRENTSHGTIRISVDESFKPVMEEQLKVFHSSYPNAQILAEYKPEAECLRDLQNDSTRLVIISRGLTSEENAYYKERLQYRPIYDHLADDAVAVVVNNAQKDSVFKLQDLRDLLSGKRQDLAVAVDGNTATSTVRYLIDSLMKGEPLGKNVTGAANSEELINYIAATPGAIGFVGISWFTNPASEQQEAAIAKMKLALVECTNYCDEEEYARPSQQTIMFRQYPLVRSMHYVLKENFSGLGSGFVNFLTLERGQLIFRRASLVPSQMQFNRRRTNLVEQ